MPGNHFIERLGQGVGIEPTGQPHRRRHIVERDAALKLVEKPEPLLGKGHGKDIDLVFGIFGGWLRGQG
jgi:hypothetical protein